MSQKCTKEACWSIVVVFPYLTCWIAGKKISWWDLQRESPILTENMTETSMEITVLNLSAHTWKYIQISVGGGLCLVCNNCIQDDLIFLLYFCFDTELLEWISSTTLRKLFILNLLHHRRKCNLHLEIWERVSLLSRNQLVNGDRNLYRRNKAINGKSSLVADQCSLDTSASTSAITQH